MEPPSQLRMDVFAPNAFVILRTILVTSTTIQEFDAQGAILDEWSADEESLARLIGFPLQYADILSLLRGLPMDISTVCTNGELLRGDDGSVTITHQDGRSWYRLVMNPLRMIEMTRIDPFRGLAALQCNLSWKEARPLRLVCDFPRRNSSAELLFEKSERSSGARPPLP